jgi:hypothetical protein
MAVIVAHIIQIIFFSFAVSSITIPILYINLFVRINMINDTPANTAAVNSVSNVSSCVFLYSRNSKPFLNGIAAKKIPETKAVIIRNIDCLYSKAAAIANAKSKIQIFTNTLIFLRIFIYFSPFLYPYYMLKRK